MWMMMDSINVDHGREFKLPGADPVIGRKLRPLMPRPLSNTPYSTPSCCCIRNPNILSWNHAAISEDGVKREVEMAVVSTRWNPTPEQLQALEEMYRGGIRTPSAEQIQQIATTLGRFGKIEGKNVFYWFQNHKARERQKKRRQQQLHLLATKPPPAAAAAAAVSPPPIAGVAAGVSRRYLEIEHQNKVSRTASEDSASMHGAVIAAGKDGWHHKELQQIANAENEIRCSWQLNLDLSSNFNSNSNSNNRLRLGLGQENTKPYLSSNLINLNINIDNEEEEEEDPTLELFPTPTSTTPPPPAPQPHQQQQQHIPPHFTKIMPPHFIEFLPIVKT